MARRTLSQQWKRKSKSEGTPIKDLFMLADGVSDVLLGGSKKKKRKSTKKKSTAKKSATIKKNTPTVEDSLRRNAEREERIRREHEMAITKRKMEIAQKENEEYNRHIELKGIQTALHDYQNIVNTSTSPSLVKDSLDRIIELIDAIMAYDENDLKAEGYTKVNMTETKQFLLENYDTLIAQAEERQEEERVRVIIQDHIWESRQDQYEFCSSELGISLDEAIELVDEWLEE